MQEYSMPNIVNGLELPEHSKAIELFAGDGSKSTAQWAHLPESLVGVDVDVELLTSFVKRYSGKAFGIPCDTIKGLHGETELSIWKEKYDLISCDNPDGVYGEGYVEHFDIVKDMLKLAAPKAFLILRTNLKPHNFEDIKRDSTSQNDMKMEEFEMWMKRREGFYINQSRSVTEKEMIDHYIMAFTSFGRRARYVASDLQPLDDGQTEPNILYVLFRFAG